MKQTINNIIVIKQYNFIHKYEIIKRGNKSTTVLLNCVMVKIF